MSISNREKEIFFKCQLTSCCFYTFGSFSSTSSGHDLDKQIHLSAHQNVKPGVEVKKCFLVVTDALSK
jgi:hypothetical protein